MTTTQKRSYLIRLADTEPKRRSLMRNALYRLGATEILPGLYLAHLTAAECQSLSRRFGVRTRAR
jgi:hypothetical protein